MSDDPKGYVKTEDWHPPKRTKTDPIIPPKVEEPAVTGPTAHTFTVGASVKHRTSGRAGTVIDTDAGNDCIRIDDSPHWLPAGEWQVS